jgi:hypothetical protein
MIPWIGISTLIGKYKVITVKSRTPPPIPVAADSADVKNENRTSIPRAKGAMIILIF